ncbi:MAG: class I SAM-dependent methyltransferase [Planctomycetales bacterium]|nr:class I SAM-dependent methyltransferase [Planctomycetales bacterium]
MSFLADLKVLYHLAFKRVKGDDHAARLDSFYSGQAGAYDDFRKRLLKGRQEMVASIPFPDNAVWVDMGGGTGANVEFAGNQTLARLQHVHLVDLSKSLLDVAKQRIQENTWTNVSTSEADATTFTPPEGSADVVTFSYSLTMIPDWFAAIDNARRILKPGGMIGVVDFYIARKYPAMNRVSHNWFTRSFWPSWFSNDNVFPSADHLPYLDRHFECLQLTENRAKVPYLPFVRVPYYTYLGRLPHVDS